MDNIKIPTEKADKIIPYLRQIKQCYGIPLALVHDMGPGILLAVKEAVTIFRKSDTTKAAVEKNADYLKMVKQIDKYWRELFADPSMVQLQMEKRF